MAVSTAGHAVQIAFTMRQTDDGFNCSFQPFAPAPNATAAAAAAGKSAPAAAAAAAAQNCSVYIPLPPAAAALPGVAGVGLLAVSVGRTVAQSTVGGRGGAVAAYGDRGWAVGRAPDGDVVRRPP